MKSVTEALGISMSELMDYARANTKYNENGDAVISRDDPWFDDDVWEKDYEELMKAEREYSNAAREA